MDLYKNLEELVTFSDYCTLHSKYNRTSLPCLVRDERGMEGVAATLYGERADDQTMWVCCEGRPRIGLLSSCFGMRGLSDESEPLCVDIMMGGGFREPL